MARERAHGRAALHRDGMLDDDAEPPKFFVSRVFLAPEPTPEPALDDVADYDED